MLDLSITKEKELESKYGKIYTSLVLFDLEPLFNVRTGLSWINQGYWNKDFVYKDDEIILYPMSQSLWVDNKFLNNVIMFLYTYKRKISNYVYRNIIRYLATFKSDALISNYQIPKNIKTKKFIYRINKLKETYESKSNWEIF